MKKIFKRIMLVLLAALVVIQFIHPKKNKAEGPQPNYIGARYAIPEDVKTILAKACNDCHSNNTKYPWYATLQPVHWWMNKHVKEGKKEINFDEIASKPAWLINKKMDEVIKEVKEGEMPLNSYTLTHKDATLTQEEKEKITNWAQSVQDTLKVRFPADSLKRPKK